MNNNSTQNAKRLVGIRGAACAENKSESIIEATIEMCEKIIVENSLTADDMVSVLFSLTKDLTAFNPATAFRKNCKSIDTSNLALFTCQEAYIDGGSDGMIRVLVTAYMPSEKKVSHVYVRGAEKLRPDLKK